MESQAIGIRWFNDACYEIKLPNGKSILTDPYIDDSPNKLLSSEALNAADYILISHSHFDHTLGLTEVLRRFDSQIFCGAQSGVEIARYYDIPGYAMNLILPGETVETGDFRLQAFRGKHTKLPAEVDRPSQWQENVEREGLPVHAAESNLLGSYEYMIWLLTLRDHRRILIWGGAANEAAIAQAPKWEPDITIAQIPRDEPEQIGRLYGAIGGQFIFPHHHEYFQNGGVEGQAILDAVAGATKQYAPCMQLVFPKKGKWYYLRATLAEETEEGGEA